MMIPLLQQQQPQQQQPQQAPQQAYYGWNDFPLVVSATDNFLPPYSSSSSCRVETTTPCFAAADPLPPPPAAPPAPPPSRYGWGDWPCYSAAGKVRFAPTLVVRRYRRLSSSSPFGDGKFHETFEPLKL